MPHLPRQHAVAATAAALLLGLASAQQPKLHFERVAAPDSRLEARVIAIAQDEDRGLWLGTRDGLFRISGPELRELPLWDGSPELRYVSALLCDRNGDVWAATVRGVHRIDAATGDVVQVPVAKKTGRHPVISCGLEDPGGGIWFGGRGGVYRYEPERHAIEPFRQNHDRELLDVRSLAWSSGTGEVLAGSSRGVFAIDVERGTARELGALADRNGASNVRALAIRDEVLWVGADDGLHALELRRGTQLRIPEPLLGEVSGAGVRALMVDRAKRLWIADTAGSLVVHGPGTASPHRYETGRWRVDRLPSRPLSMFEDRSGTVWIGMRDGVCRVDPQDLAFRWLLPQTSADPASSGDREPHRRRADSFLSVWIDADGTKWIGTTSGNLLRVGPDGAYTCVASDADASGAIHDVCRDSRDRLWVAGLDGGLWRHDGSGSRCVRIELAGDAAPWRIFEDRSGRLWLACRTECAIRIDADDDVTRLDYPRAGRIEQVFEDRAGTIWLASSEAGLLRWDARSDALEPVTIREQLDHVYAIAQTDDATLWLSTNAGIVQLDLDSHVVREGDDLDPLLGETFHSMLADREGILWAASSDRLVRFDPRAHSVRSFRPTPEDENVKFLGDLSLQEGRLWVAAGHGLLSFDPRDFAGSDAPAYVRLTRAVIDDAAVLPSRFDGQPHRIHLGPGQSFLQVEVATTVFSDPSRTHYGFRLDGASDDWLPGRRGSISFSNLRGGDYELYARATNAAGVWSPQRSIATISVEPVFWRTGWFMWGCVFALTLLAFSIPWLRARAIQRSNQRLQRLVNERTSALASRNETIRQIGDVVEAINSSRDLHQLLEVSLKQVTRISGASRARALVLERGSGNYRLRCARGWTTFTPETMLVPPVSMSRCVGAESEALAPGLVRTASDPMPAVDALAEAERPRETLAIRIDLERHDEAVVLLDYMTGDRRCDATAIESLESLREPIASALIKARLLEELIELNEMKSELMGATAHDLRNPLTAVKATASLLADSLATGSFDRAEATADLERVQRAAAAMADRLNELVDATALEAGTVTLRPKLCDPREPLWATVGVWESAARRKGVVLRVRESTELPKLVFDRDRIATVMDNLISNAIKFTEPGGEVEIDWQVREDDVAMHVRDTGLGLPPEDVENVFTSPRPLSAKPTAGEPTTGLGLTIVRRVVELHGGSVWVESDVGRGSTFSFSLPRVSPLSPTDPSS